MRTRFKNFAFFYDQDSIGGTDRGKPVSDDKTDTPMKNRFQSFLDEPLGLRIDRRGGFIHNENPGLRK